MSEAVTAPLAIDTSVAIPLLVDSHAAHEAVTRWRRGRAIALCGHAQAETYSVLTRLPGVLRVPPVDAARVLATGFAATVLLSAATTRRLPTLFAAAGIAGGAVYDALVALAARDHGLRLATRDARAVGTYEALGVTVEVVG